MRALNARARAMRRWHRRRMALEMALWCALLGLVITPCLVLR